MSIDTGQQTIHIGESGNRGGHGSIGLSGRRGIKGESKGTFLIVAARYPVCGELVCLDRSTYQNNYKCPLCLPRRPALGFVVRSQSAPGARPFTCSIPWERRFRRAWSGYSGRPSGPTSEQECRNIKRFRLPIDEEILIVCSWILGGLDDMLEAIRTEPW